MIRFVLIYLADCHNPTLGCFPTQAYLAEVCGISRASINRHLDELERLGLIARTRRLDPDTKKQLPTRYRLAFEPDFEPQDVVSRVSNLDTDTRVSNSGVAVSHSYETQTSNITIPPISPNEGDDAESVQPDDATPDVAPPPRTDTDPSERPPKNREGLFVITPDRPEWPHWLKAMEREHGERGPASMREWGYLLTKTQWPNPDDRVVTPGYCEALQQSLGASARRQAHPSQSENSSTRPTKDKHQFIEQHVVSQNTTKAETGAQIRAWAKYPIGTENLSKSVFAAATIVGSDARSRRARTIADMALSHPLQIVTAHVSQVHDREPSEPKPVHDESLILRQTITAGIETVPTLVWYRDGGEDGGESNKTKLSDPTKLIEFLVSHAIPFGKFGATAATTAVATTILGPCPPPFWLSLVNTRLADISQAQLLIGPAPIE